jgi:hypothetical protein
VAVLQYMNQLSPTLDNRISAQFTTLPKWTGRRTWWLAVVMGFREGPSHKSHLSFIAPSPKN